MRDILSHATEKATSHVLSDQLLRRVVFGVGGDLGGDVLDLGQGFEGLDALLIGIETVLGISVKVRLVEPKSIERSEGKAKRIIDKRSL